ncbi:protein FAR1-RELATED SEQUENCE 5-like [Diospyros lotus]|uniref:protein FAR1-RELATED SEQUENCE 5-like n=1 Tax=Diospyros lotus TaxID=55363 RepID=UPI002257F10F|nr:protein FAR1-RELATED SEQUENCE 5-like [Diospyros lotus]XP_052187078.1 protein FAR1-RELATED SEQUENCE 5-like [Diospyros lotus]
MCEEAGGAQNLNFTRSDCNNLLQRTRAKFFKKGDAECLLEYFKQKKGENKHFFYYFRTREDGEIRGVFFCDAKSRRDYGLFGDAICFDTTFRTNNYDMLCAPIVGINHHGQTSLFGCGLLDDETIDAVMWLFTTFFEAMGGKKPRSIFTDQSAAISSVIDTVLPSAHHGLCLWHLCQNAAKNLSNDGYKSFAPQFKACIYNPETVEEFEQSWDKLLEDNGLRGNEWLQRTYELRKKWAQVYNRAHFCAGMTTSQRSESINKFLKDYFNHSRIVLREFVSLYSRAMDNRREKEREAEHLTQQTTPNLVCNWSVEHEVAKKYTKKIFYWFQEGIKQTIDLSLELDNDDGTIRTYKAKEIEGQQRIRTLTYNQLEQTVSCTCRSFEFNGIICSHALKLFRHLEFKSLPSQYYLKRWTRAATHDIICDPMGEIIPNDNDPMLSAHYSELSQISQKIIVKGSRSLDFFSLSKSLLLEVEEKIEALAIAFD